MNSDEYIKITDKAALKAARCPFTASTLRTYYSRGKYPGLIVKRWGRLYVARKVLSKV